MRFMSHTPFKDFVQVYVRRIKKEQKTSITMDTFHILCNHCFSFKKIKRKNPKMPFLPLDT